MRADVVYKAGRLLLWSCFCCGCLSRTPIPHYPSFVINPPPPHHHHPRQAIILARGNVHTERAYGNRSSAPLAARTGTNTHACAGRPTAKDDTTRSVLPPVSVRVHLNHVVQWMLVTCYASYGIQMARSILLWLGQDGGWVLIVIATAELVHTANPAIAGVFFLTDRWITVEGPQAPSTLSASRHSRTASTNHPASKQKTYAYDPSGRASPIIPGPAGSSVPRPCQCASTTSRAALSANEAGQAPTRLYADTISSSGIATASPVLSVIANERLDVSGTCAVGSDANTRTQQTVVGSNEV